MKYFIANWKANKNTSEVEAWIKSFKENYRSKNDVCVIVCPPFPFVRGAGRQLTDLGNVFIGSQTISSKEFGSYTGEVTAKTLEGLVSYSIIGHSERRKNFGEKDEDLIIKVNLAKKYGIEPIYCIRDEKDPIPAEIKLLAYEPVAAIGTGLNESPKKVVEVKKKLNLAPETAFIYGGSVDENNAKDYLTTQEVDGFLVGGASLDPSRFFKLISSV